MKKLDSVRKIQERINPINEIDSQTRNREKVNIRKTNPTKRLEILHTS
jgi:hypothetical protein